MTRGAGWTVAVTACILAAAACMQSRSATTSAGALPIPTRRAETTTLDSVYTIEQATKGRTTFLTTCRECHAESEETGDAFDKRWLGKTLGDLFQYLTAEMPKNDPGSLPADEYAGVVAYMLRMNGMPAGAKTLSTEVDSLKQIRIAKKPAEKPPLE